jgi:uncharacterized damage-inducible protein DinB
MKELLLQYARYNAWANKRILHAVSNLDEEALNKTMVSSFPTIKATIYHIWSAESIWLQRLLLTENPVWADSVFEGSFETACAEWLAVSDALIQFTERQRDDVAFEHIFQFYHDKESYKFPVYTALNHVFNHSSQHRGQINTMLRQAGYTKLQSLDLCTYITT